MYEALRAQPRQSDISVSVKRFGPVGGLDRTSPPIPRLNGGGLGLGLGDGLHGQRLGFDADAIGLHFDRQDHIRRLGDESP